MHSKLFLKIITGVLGVLACVGITYSFQPLGGAILAGQAKVLDAVSIQEGEKEILESCDYVSLSTQGNVISCDTDPSYEREIDILPIVHYKDGFVVSAHMGDSPRGEVISQTISISATHAVPNFAARVADNNVYTRKITSAKLTPVAGKDVEITIKLNWTTADTEVYQTRKYILSAPLFSKFMHANVSEVITPEFKQKALETGLKIPAFFDNLVRSVHSTASAILSIH